MKSYFVDWNFTEISVKFHYEISVSWNIANTIHNPFSPITFWMIYILLSSYKIFSQMVFH